MTGPASQVINNAANAIAALDQELDTGKVGADEYRTKMRAVLDGVTAGERDAIDRHLAQQSADIARMRRFLKGIE